MIDFKNVEVQEEICELFLSGLTPQEIQAKIGAPYHQPIYSLLKKRGIYFKRPTRYSRKYYMNEDFFEVIDTEEKAYFLGFIAADGWVDPLMQRVRLQIHSKDSDVLHKLASATNCTAPVIYFQHHGHPHCKLSLNSKKLKQDVINKGIGTRKSLTMNSEVLRHIPDALVCHFMRGYFDGDGHISLGLKYSSGVKYTLSVIGTKKFLEDTFGTYCINNADIKKYKTCDMWHWTNSSMINIVSSLKFLYEGATVFMNRKYDYISEYLHSECAHVKLGELLETFPRRERQSAAEPCANTEGSETRE